MITYSNETVGELIIKQLEKGEYNGLRDSKPSLTIKEEDICKCSFERLKEEECKHMWGCIPFRDSSTKTKKGEEKMNLDENVTIKHLLCGAVGAIVLLSLWKKGAIQDTAGALISALRAASEVAKAASESD